MQQVQDLDHILQENVEFLFVVGKHPAFGQFVCDDKIGFNIGVGPPDKMVEVTVRQEIGFLVVDVIPFLAENVLLLDAIILSQHFDDIHKQLMEIVVSLNIGSVLNHRVLAFDDNRVIANHVVHD